MACTGIRSTHWSAAYRPMNSPIRRWPGSMENCGSATPTDAGTLPGSASSTRRIDQVILTMDWTLLHDPLFSARMPALPEADAMRLARHIIWACVLGGAGFTFARRLGSRWRLPAGTVLVAWTLV